MHVGIALPQFGASAELSRIAEFAAEIEALGYHSLWAADRLLTPIAPRDPYPAGTQPYPPEFTRAADPFVVWAAAASATNRVRLGSSTLNAPFYNPVLLARALTTIDVVSNGRLDVGFGLGWMRDEYQAAGTDWALRGARLDETIDVLHAWWRDNPVEFHGRFADFPASIVDLRPIQQGGPPIYLGGFTHEAMQRVGQRAQGYLAVAGPPEQVQTQLWDAVRHAAEAHGRDASTLRRILRINPTHDDLHHLPAMLDGFARTGYDEAFLDLNYSVDGIDKGLLVARDVIARYRG